MARRGKLKRPLFLLASALTLAGGIVALPAAAETAARKDWSRMMAATPEGGFRIGNPDAAVKLVEYGSLTCSHCAAFHSEAMDELKRSYIASGRLSYEFRNFVANGPDLAASLIARCEGSPAFFRHADYFLAQQQQWLPPFQSIPLAERERLSKLPQEQMLLGFVDAAGLDDRMAARGMAPGRVRQCLADEGQIGRLIEMRKAAVETHKVKGTPSFLINGKLQNGVHNWAALKPLLGAGG